MSTAGAEYKDFIISQALHSADFSWLKKNLEEQGLEKSAAAVEEALGYGNKVNSDTFIPIADVVEWEAELVEALRSKGVKDYEDALRTVIHHLKQGDFWRGDLAEELGRFVK